MSQVVPTVLLLAVQEQKIGMHQLQLKPETLAEMVGLIEDGTISGKIGKEILPGLLQVGTAQVQHVDGHCRICNAALSSRQPCQTHARVCCPAFFALGGGMAAPM